jgi:hypothetical protein
MSETETTFHESYGTVTPSLLRTIKASNVSQSDWDFMLYRWGFTWDSPNLPFNDIERFITVHSQRGHYAYPMYQDED